MIEELLERFVQWIINLFKKEDIKNNEEVIKQNRTYIKKRIMTDTEINFYNKLKNIVNDEYIIWPQINLSSIINIKENYKYRNELFRNIDYGIFDKNTFELLLLIELNDESHNISYRKSRDVSVKSKCKDAGYKIISFWLNKPNDTDYVRNRIFDTINNPNFDE